MDWYACAIVTALFLFETVVDRSDVALIGRHDYVYIVYP